MGASTREIDMSSVICFSMNSLYYDLLSISYAYLFIGHVCMFVRKAVQDMIGLIDVHKCFIPDPFSSSEVDNNFVKVLFDKENPSLGITRGVDVNKRTVNDTLRFGHYYELSFLSFFLLATSWANVKICHNWVYVLTFHVTFLLLTTHTAL